MHLCQWKIVRIVCCRKMPVNYFEHIILNLEFTLITGIGVYITEGEIDKILKKDEHWSIDRTHKYNYYYIKKHSRVLTLIKR